MILGKLIIHDKQTARRAAMAMQAIIYVTPSAELTVVNTFLDHSLQTQTTAGWRIQDWGQLAA